MAPITPSPTESRPMSLFEKLPVDGRTELRTYQRARAKKEIVATRKLSGMPKGLLQFCKRHGHDARSVRQEYVKHSVFKGA